MITKKELVKLISDDTGLTRRDAAAAVDSLLSHIGGELATGGRVLIQGFGAFETATHYYRGNPVTAPVFRPGDTLRSLTRPLGSPGSASNATYPDGM